MKRNRRAVLKSLGAGTAVLAGGVGTVSARPPSEGDTIVDVASDVDRFSILVAAVKRAGLVGTLSGNRQLTVFAPNNTAFGDFLGETDYDSLADIPDDVLRSVLAYHVAPGERDASAVIDSEEIPTLDRSLIDVDVTGGTVHLNDGQATVVTTDIPASNGYIHEIDGVLLP